MSAGSAGSGAATGAAGGAAFGPWGAGIGALLGGLLGLFKRGDKPIDSPELRRLLERQRAQYMAQGPLAESVARSGFQRLPQDARANLPEPSLQWANSQVPAISGGDGDIPPEIRAILREMEVRDMMMTPLSDAVRRMAGARMTIGTQPRGFTFLTPGVGNGPYGAPGGPGWPPGYDPSAPPTPPPPDQGPEFPRWDPNNPWMPNYSFYR